MRVHSKYKKYISIYIQLSGYTYDILGFTFFFFTLCIPIYFRTKIISRRLPMNLTITYIEYVVSPNFSTAKNIETLQISN